MSKPFLFDFGMYCWCAAREAAASQLRFAAAAVSNCFGKFLRWVAIGVIQINSNM